MADRGKVIKGLEIHINWETNWETTCTGCSYFEDGGTSTMRLQRDALELLKEQEKCVSIPFTWLVKFCTHIDFNEPMSYEERAERWKEKLSQQFGVKWDD